MRKITRAVKQVLRYYYPDEKFKVKYKESYSYISTSDKIIVQCREGLPLDEIIARLKKHTHGIMVHRKNDVAIEMASDKAGIYLPDTEEFVDAEMMKFIFVHIVSPQAGG